MIAAAIDRTGLSPNRSCPFVSKIGRCQTRAGGSGNCAAIDRKRRCATRYFLEPNGPASRYPAARQTVAGASIACRQWFKTFAAHRWQVRHGAKVPRLVRDLGGAAHLSEGQRQLVRRAAMLSAESERLEAMAAARGEAEFDIDLYGFATGWAGFSGGLG